MDNLQELEKLAASVKTQLKIPYSAEGVKFLEGFIERNKQEIPREEWSGLMNACAAFLGQCLIEQYGGRWALDAQQNVGVAFDQNNWAYPFAKVSKQFENGLEDSIDSFFQVLPLVMKLPPKPRKSWWPFGRRS